MFEINWAVISITLLVGTCSTWFLWCKPNFCCGSHGRPIFSGSASHGIPITWPLINLLAFYVGDRPTTNYHYATQLRLTKAGVEYSVSVEQFFAGKVISILVRWNVGFVLPDSWKIFMELCAASGFFGFYYPEIWLKETLDKRNKAIFKALPFIWM